MTSTGAEWRKKRNAARRLRAEQLRKKDPAAAKRKLEARRQRYEATKANDPDAADRKLKARLKREKESRDELRANDPVEADRKLKARRYQREINADEANEAQRKYRAALSVNSPEKAENIRISFCHRRRRRTPLSPLIVKHSVGR